MWLLLAADAAEIETAHAWSVPWATRANLRCFSSVESSPAHGWRNQLMMSKNSKYLHRKLNRVFEKLT
jgi:hypothetical protein